MRESDTHPEHQSESKVGRKELLTEEVARRICAVIARMPDADIPVTWENVMLHAERKVGHGFNRQMLSQKEWNGRKLIAEAFSEAKSVQRGMKKDTTPKYGTAPRSVLQKRIADLEAKLLAAQEALENERARKFDALSAFRTTGLDLRVLLAEFYAKSTADSNSATVTALDKGKDKK